MRPGTGETDVEMIAASLGLEAADSGRAGAAVGRDPVAEGAVLANEAATVWLRRIPSVSPFTIDQQSHVSLLERCRYLSTVSGACDRKAAVDQQGGPGDETGILGRQVKHRACDFPRPSHPLQRVQVGDEGRLVR